MKRPPDPLTFSSPSSVHLPQSLPIIFLSVCDGFPLSIHCTSSAHIFGATVRLTGVYLSRSGCWFRISTSIRRIYDGLCTIFLLVLGDEAPLSAPSLLILAWGVSVLFNRTRCTVSKLWPYSYRFAWIWSFYGGYPQDLQLMLICTRIFGLHCSASYRLPLACDLSVFFTRFYCSVSNRWPFLCSFARIGSSNGRSILDLHLMLKRARSCWPYSYFPSFIQVRFAWLGSSNGRSTLDSHLMLKSARSCWPYSYFSSSLRCDVRISLLVFDYFYGYVTSCLDLFLASEDDYGSLPFFLFQGLFSDCLRARLFCESMQVGPSLGSMSLISWPLQYTGSGISVCWDCSRFLVTEFVFWACLRFFVAKCWGWPLYLIRSSFFWVVYMAASVLLQSGLLCWALQPACDLYCFLRFERILFICSLVWVVPLFIFPHEDY